MFHFDSSHIWNRCVRVRNNERHNICFVSGLWYIDYPMYEKYGKVFG